MFIALTLRGAAAAYAGRIHDARSDLDEAVAVAQRCGSMRMGNWPVTLRAFLEVSCGNYQAALDAVAPLLPMAQAFPDATEIIAASYLPEAIEAMIGVGRLVDAEPLIDTLERNGRRLDRAWMLTVALRSRAMLLAARGDLTAATGMAELAMTEHERLPMPFERARTQLLLDSSSAANASAKPQLPRFAKRCKPSNAPRCSAVGRARQSRTGTGYVR